MSSDYGIGNIHADDRRCPLYFRSSDSGIFNVAYWVLKGEKLHVRYKSGAIMTSGNGMGWITKGLAKGELLEMRP